MGQQSLLIKVALVLAFLFTLSAQAQIKVKSIKPKSLKSPDVVGQRQIVKPRRKDKDQEWLALVVDYVSAKSLKDVTFVWRGFAKSKQKGKIYQFRKEVSYSLVPGGENYAVIFVDPEAVKQYYGTSVKKLESEMQLSLYVNYKGKKVAGPYYYKKGKISTKGSEKPYKKTENGKQVDFFQNKKESPFASSQVGQFNTIK